ncbi:hypothetical protein FHY19_000367 [Xanthomonas arboricola]|nr:hypothetical protein [Xanthomonas sp. 4461]
MFDGHGRWAGPGPVAALALRVACVCAVSIPRQRRTGWTFPARSNKELGPAPLAPCGSAIAGGIASTQRA